MVLRYQSVLAGGDPFVERVGEEGLERGTVAGIEVCGASVVEDVGVDVSFLGIDLLGVGIIGTNQYFGERTIVLPSRSSVGIGLKTCYQLLLGAIEVLFGNHASLDGIGK